MTEHPRYGAARTLSLAGPGARLCASSGFTLLELVVAVVILTAGFLMASLTNIETIRTMIHNLSMSDQESLIDEDISQIRQMVEQYTWCSGAGTLGKQGGSCANDTPLSNNYYFPDNRPAAGQEYVMPEDSPQMVRFTDACNDETLTKELIKLIEGNKNLPLSKQGQPDNSAILTRSLSLANANPVPAAEFGVGRQTHLLRISYRRVSANPSEPVERDVLILPPVSAWCP